jgi:hypothetical protein
MYNRPLPDLGTADDRTLLTTNDRNTGSSRPIKCIAHKISRPQHGFWHGYVLREEGTHCIYSSHTLYSVSHVLHQRTASHSSYILHLTPYVLHLTPSVLHLTPYVLHLISYRIVFCTVWNVYVLCVRHIHDPMLLP